MFIDFASEISPVKVISAYRLRQSPIGVTVRQERRRCWGIALKAQGQTLYSQDGNQILSNKNHIILLPKGGQYTWKCTQPGECMIIDFEAPEIDGNIRSVETADSGYLQAAFSRIEKQMNLDTPVSRLEAMQQLYGIFVFLTKAANKKYTPKDNQLILAPAMDYMITHYDDPQICNESLAALCGISTVYFRKTFDGVYGTSPIRYLHRLRISKAKAILLGDYDSIGQIAESVGYSNVYHFSKMFKIYTGVSPSEYAKSVH